MATKKAPYFYTEEQKAELIKLGKMEDLEKRRKLLEDFAEKIGSKYVTVYGRMNVLTNMSRARPKGSTVKKNRKPWGSNRINQPEMTVNQTEIRFPIENVRLETSPIRGLELILGISRPKKG